MKDEPKPDAEPEDAFSSKPDRGVMTAEELLAAYADGRRDFSGLLFSEMSINGGDQVTDLSDCDFGRSSFEHVRMRCVVLNGCSFDEATFRSFDLSWGTGRTASFRGARLESCRLEDCDLSRADFSCVQMAGCCLDRSVLIQACFRRSSIVKGSFVSVDFYGADLSRSKVYDATLASSNLTEVNLRRADLTGSDFRDTDLTDIYTDEQTCFRSVLLAAARIRAHTILDIQGLAPRQKMRLQICDSLATLRQDYSGFWLWVHLVALVLFLSPYVGLIVRATVATAISPQVPASASSLLAELLWFIASGGQREHVWGWGVGIFVFGVVYNGLRGALLYKTHTLILKHEISGLPLTYVLEHDAPWFFAYRAAKFLFWANVAVAAWHLILALSEPVVLHPHF